MRVIGGQRRQLRREDRGERMFVLRPIDAQHRFHAREGARPARRRPQCPAPKQHDRDFGVRNALGAGDALRRGGIQRFAVVLADDENLVH